jgi:hypothetical protein
VSLRALPSVDRLLQAAAADGVDRTFGRKLTLQALKATLAEARLLIRQGGQPCWPPPWSACRAGSPLRFGR